MKIRIKAPEGYRLYDPVTDRSYSEVVIDYKDRDRFQLIPATETVTLTEEGR